MPLISKFDKWFRFLLFVIGIYSKYTCVITLKDKNDTTITNALQKILIKCNRKPNEIWVDQGSEFYNRSMKSFSQNNHIKMYSIHNEGESVNAERFIKTLKKLQIHEFSFKKCVYWQIRWYTEEI